MGLPRRTARGAVGAALMLAAMGLSALAAEPLNEAPGSAGNAATQTLLREPVKPPGMAASPGTPDAAARSASPGNLVGHGGPVKALAVDGTSGLVLSGSFDYAMMVWDVSGDEPRRVHRLDAHEGAVNAVAFVPDAGGRRPQRAIAAGDDGSVWLWDIESGKLVHRFKGHEGKVNAVAVSPDGLYAATASWDRSARVWDLKQLAPGPVLVGHNGPVNAVAFSASGDRVYTGGYDGLIIAWDRADGRQLHPVLKHGWGINVLARLPGSEQLAWGALSGASGVVDERTGAVVADLPARDRPVLALDVIEKPGLVATGGGDGIVRVVRIGDWKLIEEHVNPRGSVWALRFANDGRAIYYGGLDDFVTIWQVVPRKAFEPVEAEFPRRFQVGEEGSPLSAGERDFARKCSVCHTLENDGANRAGPTLHALFGRRAGQVPGYPYSPALRSSMIVWNDETISKLFELGPERYTPGSKMPLQRIVDPVRRDALIAFLKQATLSAAADK